MSKKISELTEPSVFNESSYVLITDAEDGISKKATLSYLTQNKIDLNDAKTLLGRIKDVISINHSYVITTNDIGKYIITSGDGLTYSITIPSPHSVENGSTLYFWNNSYTNKTISIDNTLNDSSERFIGPKSTTNNSLRDFSLSSNEYLMLVSNGSNWIINSSSNILVPGNFFTATTYGQNVEMPSAGYKKFDSGLIIQWFSFLVPGSSSAVWNFPIAFPNKCLIVNATPIGTNNGGGTDDYWGIINYNNSSCAVGQSYDGAHYALTFAIGY